MDLSTNRTRPFQLICTARSGPSAATGPRGTITFYCRTNKNVCRSLEAIGCRRHGGPSQQVDDELWPPRSRGRNPILWIFSENILRAALHCKCAFSNSKSENSARKSSRGFSQTVVLWWRPTSGSINRRILLWRRRCVFNNICTVKRGYIIYFFKINNFFTI